MSLLEVVNLHKSFNGEQDVLKGATFKVESGEKIALLGESGSGKSTLLQICGLLDKSTSGDLLIEGRNCINLSDKDRTLLRRKKIGFIYQFHHLLSEFNLLENLIIPQLIAGVTKESAQDKSLYLLEKLGLSEKKFAFPSEISGGQKQRIAIIRSIINNPAIILADEPTGNLDEENAEKAFELLENMVTTTRAALIIATHSSKIAASCTRTLLIKGGIIV
jgi:lipoprotein-releasing system ATP-binding protein